MLFEIFVPLLLVLSAITVWHSAMGAREEARRQAHRLCLAANMQLLDQTVALSRLRLRRSTDGWFDVLREYRFEVSSNGRDRKPGHLQMTGDNLLSWTLPTFDANAVAPPAGQRDNP